MLPPYFHSDVHSFDARQKNEPHRTHNLCKSYIRSCLRYGMMKIELLISQPNNSNNIFNSNIYVNDSNIDRIYKLFSSKPKQIFSNICENSYPFPSRLS